MKVLFLFLFLVACSNDGSTTSAPGSAGSSTTKRGSAGGFSASLSADLAKDGSATVPSGRAAKAGSGANAGSASLAMGGDARGSGADANAGSGSKALDPKALDPKGSGATATSIAAKAGSGATGLGSAADASAGSGSSPGSGAPAGSGAKTASGATATGSGATATGSGTIGPKHHGPVKPSAEVAAIKLDLLPNWERDLDEAGTLVLNVKVRSTGDMRTFTFHYGYDDERAPADRDAYVKFLGEAKLLDVKLNRQRGSAWYLEGIDGAGRPAFRYLVNFGGKHLVCFGTLYKDAAGNALGDLRDNVIVQAKQICETLSL